jgi:hypothetical protein
MAKCSEKTQRTYYVQAKIAAALTLTDAVEKWANATHITVQMAMSTNWTIMSWIAWVSDARIPIETYVAIQLQSAASWARIYQEDGRSSRLQKKLDARTGHVQLKKISIHVQRLRDHVPSSNAPLITC